MNDEEIKALEGLIAEDTALIAELDKTFPPFVASAGRWDEVNKPYQDHLLKLRDAYWRRRMNESKLRGATENQMAQVAQVW